MGTHSMECLFLIVFIGLISGLLGVYFSPLKKTKIITKYKIPDGEKRTPGKRKPRIVCLTDEELSQKEIVEAQSLERH